MPGVNTLFRTRAVLFGDIGRDRYIDLYVANMTAVELYVQKQRRQYIHRHNSKFNTRDFGIAIGSLFFDYDNDGDLDLYLTHDANQPYILYQNDGAGASQTSQHNQHQLCRTGYVGGRCR